jgi:toxin secretion/phage lysis holin
MKNVIISVVGAVGGFLASCFGGWTESLTTLLIFMAIDFLTGLICAGVFHNSQKSENGALESKASFKGLCRKGVILLIVLVGHRIDLAIGASYVRDAVCIAFIVNETLSIIENAGLMGVPIPKVITNAIEILKKKGSDKNE